jgi:hypothetical protein
MRSFEYEITSHPPDVLQNLQYVCSPDGAGSGENNPVNDQPAGCSEFIGILDRRRREGWHFIQLFFSEKNIIACWEREKQAQDSLQP